MTHRSLRLCAILGAIGIACMACPLPERARSSFLFPPRLDRAHLSSAPPASAVCR